jgi:hypothetical protein
VFVDPAGSSPQCGTPDVRPIGYFSSDSGTLLRSAKLE